MIRVVKSGTGQFASIDFKEAASLSKTVHFYISKEGMTAQIAIEAETEPGTGAPKVAAAPLVDRELVI